MAIKKSELYGKLWASCDELRGGMDASQYKDYVLVLLFIKYISDKYAGMPYAPIAIPEGAGFKAAQARGPRDQLQRGTRAVWRPEGVRCAVSSSKDMVALKGKSDIGDQINKKIIAPLANANKLSEMPDFNDANKLGIGKDLGDRKGASGPPHQPHRHLCARTGPKGPLCGAFPGNKDLDFAKKPRRDDKQSRRHPGRRLRIPHAPLRHRKRQSAFPR
jgi:hypothetical protein